MSAMPRDGRIVASIRDGAETLVAPGALTEVRIATRTVRGTISGYFNTVDLAPLVRAVLPLDGRHTIYLTPNPVRPDLLARGNHRLVERAQHTTADRDILERRWFLTDFDPVRPAGISATDAECAAALARRDEAVAFLRGLGFPEPWCAMSGNGGHALWRVVLPNDERTEQLYQAALKALGAKFTDNAVRVDEAVFNAARIWKLYGTVAVKGDPIPGRPHRRAAIESRPADPSVLLPREPLEVLAALAPAMRTHSLARSGKPWARWPLRDQLDVLAEFVARGWYMRALSNGRHAVTCPWKSQHSMDSGISETVVIELSDPDNPFGFDCRHAHCVDRTIRDVYALLRGHQDGGPPPRTDAGAEAAGAPEVLVEGLNPMSEAALEEWEVLRDSD
jgi:hypothetical protein